MYFIHPLAFPMPVPTQSPRYSAPDWRTQPRSNTPPVRQTFGQLFHHILAIHKVSQKPQSLPTVSLKVTEKSPV